MRTSKTNTHGFRDEHNVFWASKAEFNYWTWLQGEVTADRVRELERGPAIRMEIVINGRLIGTYTPDMRCLHMIERPGYAGWARVFLEVKGWRGQSDWPFRKKVIEAACGITITEIAASEWTDAAVARRAKLGVAEVAV